MNLNLIFYKSAAFLSELMFAIPQFQTDDMIEQHRLLQALANLIDAGQAKSTLIERF